MNVKQVILSGDSSLAGRYKLITIALFFFFYTLERNIACVGEIDVKRSSVCFVSDKVEDVIHNLFCMACLVCFRHNMVMNCSGFVKRSLSVLLIPFPLSSVMFYSTFSF